MKTYSPGGPKPLQFKTLLRAVKLPLIKKIKIIIISLNCKKVTG